MSRFPCPAATTAKRCADLGLQPGCDEPYLWWLETNPAAATHPKEPKKGFVEPDAIPRKPASNGSTTFNTPTEAGAGKDGESDSLDDGVCGVGTHARARYLSEVESRGRIQTSGLIP